MFIKNIVKKLIGYERLKEKIESLEKRQDADLSKLSADIKNVKLNLLRIEREILLLNKKLKFKDKSVKPSVCILIYHRAHWSIDSVYHELLDNGFDVKIIIVPAMELEESLRGKEINDNYAFFASKGYVVFKEYDIDNNLPDLIIYQTHWMVDYPPEYNIEKLYNKALCISIPYGFFLANIQHHQFNEKFHNLVWLNCAETMISKEMSSIYADNGGENVIVTGYPKMDSLFSDVDPYLWRNSGNKKLIWAPHYSINTDWTVDYANFHKYYKAFYEMLKNSPDIDFLLKPHPLLKSRCIQANVMTADGFDDYVSEWRSQPNGLYETKGQYMDIFRSSDAMILDSISFIAEYFYTGKPICFISKWDTMEKLLSQFNELGQLIVRQCYIAYTWEDIEHFVKEVVVKNNDYMKENRKDFYKKYLSVNEGKAGKSIVEYIKKELELI